MAFWIVPSFFLAVPFNDDFVFRVVVCGMLDAGMWDT